MVVVEEHPAAPINVAPAAIRAARPSRLWPAGGALRAAQDSGASFALQNGQAHASAKTWRLQEGQGRSGGHMDTVQPFVFVVPGAAP